MIDLWRDGEPDVPLTAEALWNFIHPGAVIVHTRMKWVWLKPSKTGGTSILRQGLSAGWICGSAGYDPKEYQRWMEWVTNDRLQEYTVWTIVRDPWERLVSALAYLHVDIEDFCRDPIFHLRSRSLLLHVMSQWPYAQHCHMVGRFEWLHRDYGSICQRLRMKPRSLPHLNASNHGTAEEDIPAHLRETVDTILSRDAEYLQYEPPWRTA